MRSMLGKYRDPRKEQDGPDVALLLLQYAGGQVPHRDWLRKVEYSMVLSE
jgi:hypothetical protein